MNKLISVAFILFAIISCNQEKNRAIDVSAVEVSVIVDRFEEQFYTSNENTLQSLKNKYPYLFPVNNPDSIWLEKINDKNEMLLFQKTQEVFKDFFDIAIQSKSAFVVIDNKTNKIIGSSRYYEFNKEDSSIIIGYTFISREYWGTVYNRNLKDLMTNYAFQFVNIIHFYVGETNYRSQKAVEKLGAIRIGALPDDTSPKTNWIYELTK